MQRFQGVLVVFLAFLIGANCADFENSTASENETESAIIDFPCASSPCKNGGTCINEGDTYTCKCSEEYGGKDCSENRICEVYGVELCGNATCFFDEERNDYNCTCDDGKVYDEALNGCIVHPCASNPCKNGGTCMAHRGTHRCLCRAMYSGKDCSEYLWCYFNGYRACGEATCHYNVVSQRVSCSCPSNEEFDEKRKMCKDLPCASSPCRNGGTCINEGDTYRCMCPDEYEEKDCSVNRACELYGSWHCGTAKCIFDEEQVDYNCTCKDVNPCASNACKGDGTCSYPVSSKREHSCLCKANYSGKESSENLWCFVKGFSACDEGACHYNVASRRMSCSCPLNQKFDEELKMCKGPCKPDPCIHGRCIEIDEHDFSCICPSKYTGKFCNETIIDACTSNPCQNGGTCYALGRQYKCICKYFYAGDTCEHGNAGTITALVVSLGTVAILSVLCGLFCYKRKQTLKKMPQPAIQLAPRPVTASEHGKTNMYPTVPRF